MEAVDQGTRAFLLVRLSFNCPTAQTIDRTETQTEYGEESKNQVVKKLWPEAHREAAAHKAACNAILDAWTVPYGTGLHCIEDEAWSKFRAVIDPQIEQTRKAFRRIFVDGYANNIEQDRIRNERARKNLFNLGDYPSKDEVERTTKVVLDVIPMSEHSTKGLKSLSDIERRDIEQNNRRRLDALRETQQRHVLTSLRRMLEDVERISIKNIKSRVEKIEVLEQFARVVAPSFTIGQDSRLQEILKTIRDSLASNKELVKYEESARVEKSSLATSLLADLDNLERML